MKIENLKLDGLAKLNIVLLLIMFLLSCQPKSSQKINPEQYQKNLINANKIMVANDDDDINNYITRHQWQMKQSGSGLRYLIYESGNGAILEKGNIVKINYEVELINGTKVDNGIKEFEVGHGGVESGIEEAMLLLKVGDKAKLILPPHLAFGLLGDENKIPSHATLIYNIKILSVK
ncbi:MAG: hypothetical protein A3K10_04640 [Bacteroidetes bacterium RIFCSPLOWO2_12_FULL_31_6]|nr:MAG: hypothetical protein A3K10_04640 [Bacteroidetes bacterium RIFCSPLOWO2_12_FULL_31_6]